MTRPNNAQIRDAARLSPDDIARQLNWSYERHGRALSWDDLVDEACRRYELARREKVAA